jgi:hypothetical protein
MSKPSGVHRKAAEAKQFGCEQPPFMALAKNHATSITKAAHLVHQVVAINLVTA